jgi:hypothetical protein
MRVFGYKLNVFPSFWRFMPLPRTVTICVDVAEGEEVIAGGM